METVALLVRLIDRDDAEIGAQRHALGVDQLAPHVHDTAALTAFVQDTLLPQVGRVTLQAYLDAVPEEQRDDAFLAVGSVELVLDPEGPQPLAWRLEIHLGEE